ncbi:MAG: phosphoserine phosphatase SerB [Panacagrimonas sp.]
MSTAATGGVDLVVQGPSATRADAAALAALSQANAVEPIGAGPTPAFRLRSPRARTGVVEAAVARQLDAVFVPTDRRLADVRIVSMDMDSTLITIECIDEIADLHGIKPQVALITASAMRGEIDFRTSLERRVALLAGLPVDALQRVYDERLRLSPGAERMLERFHGAGAQSLLVSGGFTFFTDRLKARVGLRHTLSNVLEIRDGKLTGRIVGEIVDARAKAGALRQLRAALPPGIVVAIGDGANDLPLFREADVSVAYRAKAIVRAEASHTLDFCGLDAVTNLFF